jgi:enoyl-CoA hydratase/carnithine racemase
MTVNLFKAPLPTVCAVEGHAVAGGCILALACDYRIAGEGRKLGLNEVLLGVPVPYLADLMLRQLVGDGPAKALLYEGGFIAAAEARTIGLVDDVCAKEDVEAQSIRKAQWLADLPRQAFAAIKANRVEALIQQYEAQARRKNEQFLDCWFDPGTQDLLKEAARKF